ncbi:MAG: sulfite exporter TauE/SafE family protein [Bacteroidota bacterium]
MTYVLIFAFAFLAGFIDSIVGGGGLIQMPALLILFSNMPIPTLMGTNKFAAFSGTSIATLRYIKLVDIPWKSILPAIVTALVFSFLGARVVSSINKEDIKVIVLCLLIAVAIYTFLRKDFGLNHAPKLNAFKTVVYSLLAGAVLGFYDGFFGPGTGSFLIVIFISVFGFNFLTSSVSAKLVNCATNISALSYFIYTGQIAYEIAIPIALFNMVGSFLGAKVAIKKGSAFIRTLFLFIVTCMILKFGYDIFSP